MSAPALPAPALPSHRPALRGRPPRRFALGPLQHFCRVAVLGGALIAAGRDASAQSAVAPAPPLELTPVRVREPRPTASPTLATPIELDALPVALATTEQLSARAANFHLSGNRARSFNDTLAFRGLTNTPIFGDPAVTFYLDQLPLGSGFTFPTELAGFARVTLHRGPGQNTLYGRAGSAGVVTVTTPEPVARPTGELRLGFGDYAARTVAASTQTAATGRADVLAAVNFSARDGYVTNTRLASAIDFQESLAALSRVRLRATAALELTLLATAQRTRDGVQPLVPLDGPFDAVSRRAEGVTEIDAFNLAIDANVRLRAGRLNATTSFTHWELGPYFNTLDFGFAELGNGSALTQRGFNEEIRFVATDTGALRWSAGAFFADTRTDGAFDRAFGGFTFEQSTYRINARSLAALTEAALPLSDALTLTAGLRAEESRKDSVRQEIIPAPRRFRVASDSTALLPKFAVSYVADARTTLFASLGSGYKPGGFSAFTSQPALAAFGPERTLATEAGVTRANHPRTLTVTARVFWYEIDGYQIERSFQTGAATDDYLVVNAEHARSLGGELELAWQPHRDLALALDYGRTAVTLRDFRDPYTGENFAGKQAPYAPTYDASVRATYAATSGPARGWFAAIAGTFTGRTFYTESEDTTFGQSAYALVGARLGYAPGGNRWRVTVFGENLGGKNYYSAITPGTFHGTPGAPRTLGVEWRATF